MKKIFSFLLAIVLLLSFGSLISLIVGIKKPDKEPVSEPDNKSIVLGVSGIGGNSVDLVRTDDSKNLSFEIIEDGTNFKVVSDFDNYYPYSDMSRYIDKSGNVFIYIPKFYSKFSVNQDGTTSLQISRDKLKGYSTLFIDGEGNELDYILYSAYESSGDSFRLYSRSGFVPTTSLTMDVVRTASCVNGTNYQQLDYLSTLIVNQLFTIEFATMNSQNIFPGYTGLVTTNAGFSKTGSTDVLDYDSGYIADGSFKYRGIENVYGNCWKYVDGVVFWDRDIYLSFIPSSYCSSNLNDGFTSYFKLESLERESSEGSFKSLVACDSSSALFFPSFNGTTSFGDYSVYWSTSVVEGVSVTKYGEVMTYGGGYGNKYVAGLWCMQGNRSATYTDVYYGSRLVYKPINNFFEI